MTTVYPQAWERTLLPLAYEAEHRGVAPTPIPVSDPALLDAVVTYQVLMIVSIPTTRFDHDICHHSSLFARDETSPMPMG